MVILKLAVLRGWESRIWRSVHGLRLGRAKKAHADVLAQSKQANMQLQRGPTKGAAVVFQPA